MVLPFLYMSLHVERARAVDFDEMSPQTRACEVIDMDEPRKSAIVGVVVSLLFGCLAMAAETGEGGVVQIGVASTFHSEILDADRDLVVHLPEDYQSGGRRYPVVYMMGSEFRARFALWAANLDILSGAGRIPAMILVGIDLPEGNGVLVPRGGDTSSPNRYLRFLVEEVVPHVEKGYRTVPYRVLFGASNSGLFTVYTLLSEPDAFNAYLASSPMLGWCPDLLQEKAEKILAGKGAPGRFLYMIYSDDDYEHATESIPAFVDLLAKSKPGWLSYESVVRTREGHVPATDIPLALKAVFPDYHPAGDVTTLDAVRGHYSELTKRYGFSISVPQALLFDIGVDHVIAKRLDQAQTIFEYAVKEYPEQARGHVGLGLVRREQERFEEARDLFNKAMELDPEDSLARRLLERLDEKEKEGESE
jgi:enterochelin esterase-like enzyme